MNTANLKNIRNRLLLQYQWQYNKFLEQGMVILLFCLIKKRCVFLLDQKEQKSMAEEKIYKLLQAQLTTAKTETTLWWFP